MIDAPDDDDTTTNVTDWDKIGSILWNTTNNPSCVGQGLGQCMAKLGELRISSASKRASDFAARRPASVI